MCAMRATKVLTLMWQQRDGAYHNGHPITISGSKSSIGLGRCAYAVSDVYQKYVQRGALQPDTHQKKIIGHLAALEVQLDALAKMQDASGPTSSDSLRNVSLRMRAHKLWRWFLPVRVPSCAPPPP